LEVQQIFEKMGEGVNGMLRLAAKGSQMAKHWESYTGGTRPEALMRGSIPSEYYRSSNRDGYGNILNSIGKFQDHFYDSLWNALAGAAPDAHGELDSIFRELASKPSRRSANKLRDVGVKIKDEALSSGDEDSLVEFNKLLKQWAGEQINQTSFDANAWFEQHQGSFGLGESVVKITKRQLRRVIREEASRLLEYEQYVDEDGNVYDDEGNVSRRGRSFGQRYGGQTYTGTRPPWSSRRPYRAPNPQKLKQVDAIKAVLEVKDNKFLQSILQQLESGKTLSDKQKKIVVKIIKKTAEEAGMDSDQALALFE
jgi:hypothetical protein